MVPVSTERLPTRTPSLGGDLTDDDLEDEEVAACWGADVLQLPTSLELDIRIRKGSLPLGMHGFEVTYCFFAATPATTSISCFFFLLFFVDAQV